MATRKSEMSGWDGEAGGVRRAVELTEEVREALEPLRVAERAHLDLHARRRLSRAGSRAEREVSNQINRANERTNRPSAYEHSPPRYRSERRPETGTDLICVGVADE